MMPERVLTLNIGARSYQILPTFVVDSAEEFAMSWHFKSARHRGGAEPSQRHGWGYLNRSGFAGGFNARFRDELLNREVFYSLREAQIIIEAWRPHYNNTKRPHSALGYRPPAPETIVPMNQRPVMHQQLTGQTKWG